MKQYITRLVEIDMGHRVMDERFKCSSVHGHRAKVELHFEFHQQQEIGYAIDFKEIKRIGCQWIDDMLDHGFAANPQDFAMIEACQKTQSKLYLMSLNGEGNYCNPTAENIARELFMAMQILFQKYSDLKIHQLRYYETPNCWVDAYEASLISAERENFLNYRGKQINDYVQEKGKVEYDARKNI